MKVSIVIPVYNEADCIAGCLKAIEKQSVAPKQVIVVNNNSSDDTVKLAKRFSFVTLLNESKQGRVYAQNTGFNATHGDLIGRIDADTVLPPDWVKNVERLFKASPDIAAISGKPRFSNVPFGPVFDALQVFIYQKVQKLIAGTDFLWGANMVIKRSSWLAVRERCSVRTDIDEDIDLSLCLQERGFNIKYVPELRVQASLQRGHFDTASTIRYLSTWPRDYLLHQRYFATCIISLLTALLIIVTLPLTLGFTVLTTMRR